ncbi:Tetratricopeptide repeat-containing protein [Hymenobacter gelipurpurascens]|uniref:Tetratricopeptide repeat-containing protein n=1 Tax=Hymenobacter gelipurpurascens TaxID=89968 RepID=A0A212T562_9BACT|nr:tetratricopeptide repeat protein [Hymenobacter gelipurpurascens]SNC60961.1 Tetratricopeptide repeat-containing protein [Hymenobacter gelipurpurascens]
MHKALFISRLVIVGLLGALASCREKASAPSAEAIREINLNRGSPVVCGIPNQQYGFSGFETSCAATDKADFNLAVSLLHSFEYDEAEKAFANIIDREPGCAMAYWGVAMANYHPLWAPPTPAELAKGTKAITIAQRIPQKTPRETAYIHALAQFYQDGATTAHAVRCARFEQAMAKLHATYPEDKEAAIFYALALNGAADPADKTFRRQRQAGTMLTALSLSAPNHPGIIHYIIHSYDSPELAAQALPAAKKYAAIAPSSAHAQHMPSHIFVRLGLWDDCVASNLDAAASARCYAENTGIKGHWDEELHALDYLTYAYLQKADNRQAKAQWQYLQTIREVHPANFKVAYALAAIPSRYVLENKLWQEAAHLKIPTANVAWEEFPWQKAMVHFTRSLGYTHIGQLDSARQELRQLQASHDILLRQKDQYKATQVAIQLKSAQAWLLAAQGNTQEALQLMHLAADTEDRTQKHAVTPSEVLPAREILGDLLLQLNQPQQALLAYEADLTQHPNRLNGLYGAATAASKSGDTTKARRYYQQLLKSANAPQTTRPELIAARQFLAELT